MLNTGHAVPLRAEGFPVREAVAVNPQNRHGDMNRSRPQTRQFREHEQGQDRTQTQIIRVRVQPANAFSPRAKTRQQTVRIRDQAPASTVCDQAAAADTHCPQAVRSLELSTSAISPLTKMGRESRPAMNCPRRRIVVSISPPTIFPVHIRIIRAYDFI